MIKRIGIYFHSNYELVETRDYYLHVSIIMGLVFTFFVFIFDPYETYAYPLKYNIPVSLIQVGYGINLALVIYALCWLTFLKLGKQKVKQHWKTYHLWLFLIAIELISGFSGTLYHRILIDVGEVDSTYFMLVTIPRSILIGLVLFIIWFLHGKLYEKNKRLESLQNDKIKMDFEPKIQEVLVENNVILKSPIIKQTIKLDPKNILYIKAFGNYVEIHSKEEEKSQLLRAPLHSVAKQLSTYSYIKKCHRQYYVNINEVEYFKRNSERNTLQIKGSLSLSIPVSKKYIKEMLSLF